MRYHAIQAICQLYPTLSIEIRDPDDLSTLRVQGGDTSSIDLSMVQAWVDSKTAQEPMRLLREERNRRLVKTDIYALPDYPHPNEDTRVAWLSYRQALRELPSNASPTLNERYELDMESVTWPRSPIDPVIPEPVSEPTQEPVIEPTPETMSEAPQEPVTEPTSEPVTEPTPETVTEPVPEPVPEPTPETVSEATQEPVQEPTPEPLPSDST